MASVDRYLFDESEWNKILAETAEEFLTVFLVNGVHLESQDLYKLMIRGGVLGDTQAAQILAGFNIENPHVLEFVRNYSYKFALKVNETTRDALRAQLADGLQAGESIAQLQERVSQVFGPEASKYRAEMIARTESHRAELQGAKALREYTNSELIQAGEQPVVIGRVWRANQDACEFCEAMDGKSVGLDEVYWVKGDTLEVDGVGVMKLNYEDGEVESLHPHCRCFSESIVNPVYTGG